MNVTVERPVRGINGFAAVAGAVVTFIVGVLLVAQNDGHPAVWRGVLGVICFLIALGLVLGLFIVQPNEAKVLTLFGNYLGTCKAPGFHWANPFASKIKSKVSLRVRNFVSERLKVNDADGNPVEIAAVINWCVVDTARASFDVQYYESFVETQAETAIRHIASLHPYDAGDTDRPSLREHADQVGEDLRQDLQARLGVAGVEVLETRLAHLAYSPEIAEAMLRRQQAQAVLSARRTIVQGAVGMVDDAIRQLEERGVVQLDGERRAAMVSNLMVVLTSDRTATPVVNAGSLY
jgi:regulator of protease activity HflC (stomatin/prohibitin superfamily)